MATMVSYQAGSKNKIVHFELEKNSINQINLDKAIEQAELNGLIKIKPIISNILTSIPNKMEHQNQIGQFLQNWGKTFGQLYEQYNSLNEQREKLIINLSKLTQINQVFFFPQITEITTQISYIIKAMYNAIHAFEKDFNIEINYGIFLGPTEEEAKLGKGTIKLYLEDVDADFLSDKASYDYYPTTKKNGQPGKPKLSSRIDIVTITDASGQTTLKGDQTVEAISIPIDDITLINKKNYTYSNNNWLKAIQLYWDKALQYLNMRLKNQRKIDHLFNKYLANEGTLGEGVIKAYLIQEHLHFIQEYYVQYINTHNKGKKAKTVGGPDYNLVIKDLEKIMTPDADIYLATGDFDYREVWDALKNNQAIFNSLTKTSFDDITSEEMKRLYKMYESFYTRQIQIKKNNSGVPGGTTISICKAFGYYFQEPSFTDFVQGRSFEKFEEALRVTTARSVDKFMQTLLQNLT